MPCVCPSPSPFQLRVHQHLIGPRSRCSPSSPPPHPSPGGGAHLLLHLLLLRGLPLPPGAPPWGSVPPLTLVPAGWLGHAVASAPTAARCEAGTGPGLQCTHTHACTRTLESDAHEQQNLEKPRRRIPEISPFRERAKPGRGGAGRTRPQYLDTPSPWSGHAPTILK